MKRKFNDYEEDFEVKRSKKMKNYNDDENWNIYIKNKNAIALDVLLNDDNDKDIEWEEDEPY